MTNGYFETYYDRKGNLKYKWNVAVIYTLYILHQPHNHVLISTSDFLFLFYGVNLGNISFAAVNADLNSRKLSFTGDVLFPL